jgi:hypothetical protein
MRKLDHYVYYQHAYEVLSPRGKWTQGDYQDFNGSMCFVGGLANTQGVFMPHDEIPPDLRREVERTLWLYPMFWVGKLIQTLRKEGTGAIEWWNDMPWRRKKTVLRKLKRLMKKTYTPWVVNENIRLQGEVAILRARTASLSARIEELEAEKKDLLSRFNYQRQRELTLAGKELRKLDQELNKASADLLQLEGSP